MAYLYKNGSNYHVQLFVAGKRRRFSLKTDNYGLARDKVRKFEHDLIHGDLERPTRTPISELVEQFAEHLAANARPGAAAPQTDLYRLREFIGPVSPSLQKNRRVRRSRQALRDGDPPRRPLREFKQPEKAYEHRIRIDFVEEITTGRIADFLVAIKTARKLSAKTVNEYREIVQRFLNWAITVKGVRFAGGAKINPCEGVPRYRVQNPTIRFLTIEQIHAQLDALADKPTLQALVAVYIYAGLRREEALWLTRADVDLERRVIHVRQKNVGGANWWPKTGRNRVVPISQALMRHLTGFTSPLGSVWYFPSPTGRRWDVDNFSQALSAANVRHGLHWTCLDYRHTFGSQLAMKGESLYKISEIIGNSPEICRRHYAALLPESLVASVEFDVQHEPKLVMRQI